MSRNIVIIPDSFKGTMTAVQVCEITSQAILAWDPEARIMSIPMADGGEGTCEAFRYALGGELVPRWVHGPYMEQQEAVYWRQGDTAAVELASAAGFIAGDGRRDPSAATTYGVGELIRHAIEGGCRRIILGLGGSCTNDAGAGMAAALGAVFRDPEGRPFLPVGGTLGRIRGIDLTKLREVIRGVRFEAMCDVDNPLYGRQGAAFVFAPQKGADAAMTELLDRGLRAFAETVAGTLGEDIAEIPGGGAAGGAGAGARAFFGAELKPGARIVLELNRFEELLRTADLVITGEGRLDEQSLHGKVVAAVADRAASQVPVIAVVGDTAGDITPIYEHGVRQVIRTLDHCPEPARYRETCRQDLYRAVEAWLASRIEKEGSVWPYYI